jgi:hypothetical protein
MLDSLFDDEDNVRNSVNVISVGIIDLSDFSIVSSAVDLARAEIAGKRIRVACDALNEEVHSARKKLGILLSSKSSVKFKGAVRVLHEMEDELSLIHGDLEAIGTIAVNFFSSANRKVAFDNLNRHYSGLVKHVTSLLISELELKKLKTV